MLLHVTPHHNGVFSSFVICDFVKQHAIIIIFLTPVINISCIGKLHIYDE